MKNDLESFWSLFYLLQRKFRNNRYSSMMGFFGINLGKSFFVMNYSLSLFLQKL